MEKSWENFWTTGKVEDYLTYCNRVEQCQQKENGALTSGDTRGDGTWRENANIMKDTDASSWR